MIRGEYRKEIKGVEYRDTEIKRMLPMGQYEFVDVTFAAKDTDQFVPHSLRVENGEVVRWIDIMAGNVLINGGRTKDGVVNDVAYASGNFNSNAGSWTVASGDQAIFYYQYFGDSMLVNFQIITSTIVGAPNYLAITIPANGIPLRQTLGTFHYIENGVTPGTGLIIAPTGVGELRLYKNANSTAWTAGADNQFMYGQIMIPLTTSVRESTEVPKIYRHSGSDRIPFQSNGIVLRSTSAGYTTRLLLFVERN